MFYKNYLLIITKLYIMIHISLEKVEAKYEKLFFDHSSIKDINNEIIKFK